MVNLLKGICMFYVFKCYIILFVLCCMFVFLPPPEEIGGHYIMDKIKLK